MGILHMNEQQSVTVRQATVSDLDRLAPLFDAYRRGRYASRESERAAM